MRSKRKLERARREVAKQIFDAIGGQRFAQKAYARHFRARNGRLTFVLDNVTWGMEGNYVEIYYNEDVNRFDMKYIMLDSTERKSTLLEYVVNIKEENLTDSFWFMTKKHSVCFT